MRERAEPGPRSPAGPRGVPPGSPSLRSRAQSRRCPPGGADRRARERPLRGPDPVQARAWDGFKAQVQIWLLTSGSQALPWTRQRLKSARLSLTA